MHSWKRHGMLSRNCKKNKTTKSKSQIWTRKWSFKKKKKLIKNKKSPRILLPGCYDVNEALKKKTHTLVQKWPIIFRKRGFTHKCSLRVKLKKKKMNCTDWKFDKEITGNEREFYLTHCNYHFLHPLNFAQPVFFNVQLEFTPPRRAGTELRRKPSTHRCGCVTMTLIDGTEKTDEKNWRCLNI